MQVSNTTEKALRDALTAIAPNGTADIESLNPKGSRFRVKLGVANSREKYGRRSHSGRRVAALCWHGFRDYFIALFDESPDAVVRTAQATYKGRDGFEASFEATGCVNIGSMAQPMPYFEACDC